MNVILTSIVGLFVVAIMVARRLALPYTVGLSAQGLTMPLVLRKLERG